MNTMFQEYNIPSRMDFVELPLTPDNSSLNRESGRLKVDPCRRFFPDTHYVRE
jgi:hypothetical protein